jgi:hypothetical protein
MMDTVPAPVMGSTSAQGMGLGDESVTVQRGWANVPSVIKRFAHN